MSCKDKAENISQKLHIKFLLMKKGVIEKVKGQTTIEYIVGSAVIVLLVFGMYKLLQSKSVFEGVFNWFKKTFTAGAKAYKK